MQYPPSTDIELVRETLVPRTDLRAAIFDFDGTLSLLRRNWHEVMIPMMVDVLAETGTVESRSDLHDHVEQFVMRLNGRQTIYQMIQLAQEVEDRGGVPLDPLDYKRQYHNLLWNQVVPRIESITVEGVAAETLTVPGAERLLSLLADRGLTLYLTSGTDLDYVRNEVAVLGLDSYFGARVFGALDNYQSFSKAMIIQQILADDQISGEQIIGFGDGFVEISETKKVGGLAVGVASNEESRVGINVWKRERLVQAGADIIVGDYRHAEQLLDLVGIR